MMMMIKRVVAGLGLVGLALMVFVGGPQTAVAQDKAKEKFCRRVASLCMDFNRLGMQTSPVTCGEVPGIVVQGAPDDWSPERVNIVAQVFFRCCDLGTQGKLLNEDKVYRLCLKRPW